MQEKDGKLQRTPFTPLRPTESCVRDIFLVVPGSLVEWSDLKWICQSTIPIPNQTHAYAMAYKKTIFIIITKMYFESHSDFKK